MRDIWRGVVARFEVTDEEYVRRVRLLVAVHDRWRWSIRVFYVGLTVAFVALLVAFDLLSQRFKQLGNPQGLDHGFLIGLMLGMMAGGLVLKIGHGLVTAFTALRTERLLLQYYDAVSQLTQEPREASGSTDGRY